MFGKFARFLSVLTQNAYINTSKLRLENVLSDFNFKITFFISSHVFSLKKKSQIENFFSPPEIFNQIYSICLLLEIF